MPSHHLPVRAALAIRLHRAIRFEFWPLWFFYVPVVAYILWLALKHRSATLFAAANPGIDLGGFVGESKFAILEALEPTGFVARAWRVDGTLPLWGRVDQVRSFMSVHALDFPVVLKPDVGQRGQGVVVIRDAAALERYLEAASGDTIVQEYVAGQEFGVFYVRLPGEARGRVLSVTEKRFPGVVGDGVRTVRQLVLDHPRARLMARSYFREIGPRLDEVPRPGERVGLIEIGTHSRGALFVDGGWVLTGELERAIDDISRSVDGFHIGRYDIRTWSLDGFERGKAFRIVELNGVTAEATHIYDPRLGVVDAYRTLFEQWRLAFAIGAANRARGIAPPRLSALVPRILRHLHGGGGPVENPAAGGWASATGRT
jgi:hypothetical protein